MQPGPDVTDLTRLTLADARDGLAARRFSSTELTRAHLDVIETARALNAYVLELPDRALAMARVADDKIAAGSARPLEGLPLGVKDLFCTHGVVSTACSNILRGFEPPYESTVTHQLWRDGAVMLGKLNCDEFAMGSSNETSCFGPVVSPWRRQGSNVHAGRRGIAGAHLVPAAPPAARRRRWRRISAWAPPRRTPAAPSASRRLHRHRRHQADLRPLLRWGIVAFASSLDQAGPIARTVRDAAIMLRSMSGTTRRTPPRRHARPRLRGAVSGREGDPDRHPRRSTV
jgi:aspartyl-tRNA(Asn)/glutamyl-tRNA(Gln) amidotransferase subunit A